MVQDLHTKLEDHFRPTVHVIDAHILFVGIHGFFLRCPADFAGNKQDLN
jgi:hypothetical protein